MDYPADTIHNITCDCLEAFDSIDTKYARPLLQKPQKPRSPFSAFRVNFELWIDNNGVFVSSTEGSSVDFEIEGLERFSKWIITYLELTSESLAILDKQSNHPSVVESPEYLDTFETAARDLHRVVNELLTVSDDLRRLCATKHSLIIATRFTEQDFVFQERYTSLVRYRFPDARTILRQQLGESIAIRRRILLDKRSQAEKIATRSTISVEENLRGIRLEDKENEGTVSLKRKRPSIHLGRSIKSSPSTSDPGTQFERPNLVHLPKPQALPNMASTAEASGDDFFEYPLIPAAGEGNSRIRCPFCSEELELGADASQAWKHHINDDLKPYSCLFPEMDHDQPQIFDTEHKLRKHLESTQNHSPERGTPDELDLNILVERYRVDIPRERFVCPLCETVPENVRQLLGKEESPSGLIDNLLLDHVAGHLKSLSLLALPSLQYPSRNNCADPHRSSSKVGETHHPSTLDDSLSQPPSRWDNFDTVPLAPEILETLTPSEITYIAEHRQPNYEDPDHPEYLSPKPVPDQKNLQWDGFQEWKRQNQPALHHAHGTDSVLARFANYPSTQSAESPPQAPERNETEVVLRTEDGPAALLHVAQTGNLPAARLLIKSGTDIEITDEHGVTPLLWAVSYEHVEMVRLLLDNEAEIERRDLTLGYTPLLLAVKSFFKRDNDEGRKAIIDLLLDKGAYVDSCDSLGRTALYWAMERLENRPVVESLLGYGARHQTSESMLGIRRDLTDLHDSSNSLPRSRADASASMMTDFAQAIEEEDKEGVLMFLKYVDIHAIDPDSKESFLDLAIKSKNWEIISAFLRHDHDDLLEERHIVLDVEEDY
ncbi:unnamed protein product [Clonostachys rosea]|uniref:Ankyrin repeat protein n=1 Tax=Bionectria ochroleuca TaxID=29856 RepID=A0ABY6U833_BIOOC|nr:unnamed protein product [Clonostachys rosea]